MSLSFGEWVGIISFLIIILLQLVLHITKKDVIEITFKRKHNNNNLNNKDYVQTLQRISL